VIPPKLDRLQVSVFVFVQIGGEEKNVDARDKPGHDGVIGFDELLFEQLRRQRVLDQLHPI
jgi:hypothetical protein